MANPNAVTDTDGEWLELYNPTATAIDLDGWTIVDGDADTQVIVGSVIVPAGGRVVLGQSDDLMLNGGVQPAFVFDSFALANDGDEVILLDASGNEVDRVAYDGGTSWPLQAGTSMIYAGGPGDDNNAPSLWRLADEEWEQGAGDFGTPGF